METYQGSERREKLPPIRVLLADDEPSIRNLSTTVLKRLGVAVVDAVENGQELLDKATDPNNKYDLGIFDNTMPKVEGIEALRQIREDPRFNHIRNLLVILNSGDPEGSGTEERAKALGAVYLPKPFTLPQFSELVKKTYWDSQAKAESPE